MNLFKTIFILALAVILNSCASGYKTINPSALNYNSIDAKNGISVSYKYDLLKKKYAKKETKKHVKVVALKITNNSENDVVFGKDFSLAYENGKKLYILDNEKVFKTLKQSTASYLFYLLLTPVNSYTSTNSNNGQSQTNSTPIGLVIGPGLAGGNMIAASSANKKFKNELREFNLNGITIKKGETVSGLVGIRSNNYDAIKIKLENSGAKEKEIIATNKK